MDPFHHSCVDLFVSYLHCYLAERDDGATAGEAIVDVVTAADDSGS